MNTSLILREIEHCREEMIHLSKDHELSSDVVIRASERLDKLMNAYQRKQTATLDKH